MMKLDNKTKEKIDKYFNEISSFEFVQRLKSNYSFELDLQETKGLSIYEIYSEIVGFDENYSTNTKNQFLSTDEDCLYHNVKAA